MLLFMRNSELGTNKMCSEKQNIYVPPISNLKNSVKICFCECIKHTTASIYSRFIHIQLPEDMYVTRSNTESLRTHFDFNICTEGGFWPCVLEISFSGISELLKVLILID